MPSELLPLPAVHLLALAGLLAAAVATDLRSRRIPNALVLSGLALAAMLQASRAWVGWPAGPGPGVVSALLGAGAGLLALMPLYLLRACGAGDTKLMAMVGAFVGVPTIGYAVLYTLVAGGLLSLAWMLLRGVAAQTLANVQFLLTDWMVRARGGGGARLSPLGHTAARLPYGVAIAAGTVAALLRPAIGG